MFPAGRCEMQTHSHMLTTKQGAQKNSQACFSLQHGPGQDQIYKWWIDYILPGDSRYLLTTEKKWKGVEESKSNSSDLISEWFPWKSSDREMARQLVLVSHWLFFIREGPQKIQKRVCVIQWYFKKVLVYSPFSISSHTVQYKQYKHLPSLCPWISQVCRKWQMLTCHS